MASLYSSPVTHPDCLRGGANRAIPSPWVPWQLAQRLTYCCLPAANILGSISCFFLFSNVRIFGFPGQVNSWLRSSSKGCISVAVAFVFLKRAGISDTEIGVVSVSYTHLRAHETVLDLVCRL